MFSTVMCGGMEWRHVQYCDVWWYGMETCSVMCGGME